MNPSDQVVLILSTITIISSHDSCAMAAAITAGSAYCSRSKAAARDLTASNSRCSHLTGERHAVSRSGDAGGDNGLLMQLCDPVTVSWASSDISAQELRLA